MLLVKGVGVDVGGSTVRTRVASRHVERRATVSARTGSRKAEDISLTGAICWTADDTKVGWHGLRASKLREVQTEISHRDVVERDASHAALSNEGGVPTFNCMLRRFGEISERKRRCALASK